MSVIQVRKAMKEDVSSILEIYNDAIVHTTATFDLEEQTLEEKEEWFKQFNDTYPLFVAEIEGQVVGFSSLTEFRKKKAYAKTVENSIYIHQSARGKGVAKLLLDRLIVAAKEVGHHTIIAMITKGNEISIKLHEQYKFECVGELREVGDKFEQWQDVYFYQLILDK